MQSNNPDIEDDIFEKHINEIDERETPRWEMSEEEPDEENVPPIMNHVPVAKQPINLASSVEIPAFNSAVVPRSSATAIATVPIHPVSDARCLGKNYTIPVHKNGISITQNMASTNSKEIIENGYDDDDDFERDSVKDFGGPFREQEAKYMERTSEAIYNRASAEHIRQPNPYEDDDQDSVKNFGGTSQGLSRLPSDENLCLSPPWMDEDDGHITEEDKDVLAEANVETVASEANDYKINDVLTRATTRADFRTATQHWQVEEALDFTKNFAAESSLENSRRPSSENISLTPPWIDTDRDSTYKDDDDRGLDNSSERPTDGPKVQATGNITSGVPTTTSASSGEQVPTPGQLPTKSDLPAGKPSRMSDNPVSMSLHSAPRTQPIPPDPSGVPFPGNVQSLEARPTRRITPPGKNTSAANGREAMSPMVSVKTAQQRNFADVYHNPTVTASYRVNNPYMMNGLYPGNGLHVPRAQSPHLGFPWSGSMSNNIRPYQGVQPYYGMSGDMTQIGARQHPSRFPVAPSDPAYTHSVRIQPAMNTSAYTNFRGACGDGMRMMGPPPRQAILNEVPYYNQRENFLYQASPSNRVQPGSNRQIPSLGYMQHPQVAAPDYGPRFKPAEEVGNDGPRNIPSSDPHLYMVGENIISDSDVSPVMSTRCESQSSLAVYCHTPHQDGLETASVMSFASGASTHQDLDSQIEQVRNLLAVIDSQKELAQTLFSLSNSKENCQAMRQSGCLPLLIKLQHKEKAEDPRVAREICMRSAQAMRNIISASVDDRRGRRELRVLKLLEVVRGYCIEVRYTRQRSNKERILEQALAAIMKLSFEEEHRAALGELGGVETIGDFLEVTHTRKNHENKATAISWRKYASMTLTNMTFGNTRNKKILGNSPGLVRALLGDLTIFSDEDLIQFSACVLRNLSCKPDEMSKKVFHECNAGAALMTAAQQVSGESALRTILFAVWNLSAHSSGNKMQLCETPGALGFLVKMLRYKSMSNSISVVESSGGILRNLSSHVAVNADYRAMLRTNDCFEVLLSHLRSPSLRVVGNACGILWNLSARCQEDQELLWKLNAISLLKTLVSSKNKSIAKGAGAAIKNLQNYRSANPAPVTQLRDSPSSTRKPNGSGSPSQTHAREGHLGGMSRSRDMQSLNSFTGSADEIAKEGLRKTSKPKDKLHSGLLNGDADSSASRPKGVRWVDDRPTEKRSGKEPLRKTSVNEKKRSPDEQQSLLTDGSDAGATKDQCKMDDVMQATSAIAQLNVSEKNRLNKKSDRSPKVKKNSKNKKHVLDNDDFEMDNMGAAHARDSQSIRSASQSTSKHACGNTRRAVYTEGQRSNSLEKSSGRTSGKLVRTKEVNEGRVEHGGNREEDTEVPRSETSDDDNHRATLPASRSNAKIVRKKSSDENNEGAAVTKKAVDAQRCQCPEETGVWVKRNKRCERCQRRRVSHSSESTGGSRRSSYESLPSSVGQSRNETGTSGTGYVTTL